MIYTGGGGYSTDITLTTLLSELEVITDEDTMRALGGLTPNTEPVVTIVDINMARNIDIDSLGLFSGRSMSNIQVSDKTLLVEQFNGLEILDERVTNLPLYSNGLSVLDGGCAQALQRETIANGKGIFGCIDGSSVDREEGSESKSKVELESSYIVRYTH